MQHRPGEAFETLVCHLLGLELEPAGFSVCRTPAGHDNGIDAVATNPDPLRGGRILIQAKRRSTVLQLGAVRELYGVVQSEGAGKGVLVTNSHFGKGAYAFVANKPISLLDGTALEALMQKHGLSPDSGGAV